MTLSIVLIFSQVVPFIVAAWFLNEDYYKDKGLNIKAKFCHAIAVFILVWLFAGVVPSFITVGLNFEYWNDYYSKKVGDVPGTVNLISNYAQMCYQLTVLVLTMLLAKRNFKAKKTLLILLPFWIFSYVENYYRNIAGDYSELNLYRWESLLIGVLFMLGIAGAFTFLYTRKFMKKFFD
jgi:hypothetical protein